MFRNWEGDNYRIQLRLTRKLGLGRLGRFENQHRASIPEGSPTPAVRPRSPMAAECGREQESPSVPFRVPRFAAPRFAAQTQPAPGRHLDAFLYGCGVVTYKQQEVPVDHRASGSGVQSQPDDDIAARTVKPRGYDDQTPCWIEREGHSTTAMSSRRLPMNRIAV